MRRFLILPVWLAALWGLAGCQPTIRSLQADTPYVPLAGAVLVLEQPFEVPPQRTRVFIQDGRVLRGQGFDHYRPHCNLEVSSLRDAVQTIPAGTYPVRRVQGLREEVVKTTPGRPVQLAALGHGAWQLGAIGLMVNAGPDHGSAMLYEGFHFWLSVDGEPALRRLTCRGAFAEPWDVQPPTLEEIAVVLGELGRLDLPASE